MKIIIPMSGVGQRFQDAGYQLPKPLILVDDKPIIQHVVEMFSIEDEFVFIISGSAILFDKDSVNISTQPWSYSCGDAVS